MNRFLEVLEKDDQKENIRKICSYYSENIIKDFWQKSGYGRDGEDREVWCGVGERFVGYLQDN